MTEDRSVELAQEVTNELESRRTREEIYHLALDPELVGSGLALRALSVRIGSDLCDFPANTSTMNLSGRVSRTVTMQGCAYQLNVVIRRLKTALW